ncbi:hypothetical protein ACFQV4_14820 [Streptomyces thermocarboxydus]
MSGQNEYGGAEGAGAQDAPTGQDRWRAGDEPSWQDGERRPVPDSAEDADGEAARAAPGTGWARRNARSSGTVRSSASGGDPGPAGRLGVPGEARAAARVQRAAQARFDIRGNSSVFDRTSFDRAHFGDVYIGARDTGAPVFGDVPEDELDRLRQVYRPRRAIPR